MDSADANYSFNPWMETVPRPGDNVDPTPLLTPEAVITEVVSQAPFPESAGITPRLLGVERTQPGISDVLQVGPVPGLMKDTETRQESGMQGTLRPSTGAW